MISSDALDLAAIRERASLCGYAVLDRDGNEEPCNRPATGWRWYQDCRDHEDCLDVACDLHANEGGRRIAAAEATLAERDAEVARLRAAVVKQAGEALEDIEHWGGYADEYFAKKWDLQGCLDMWRARAALSEAQLP